MNYHWTEKIFKVYTKENKLGDEKRKIFHLFVMKAMFLTKRRHADVHPAIYFLYLRVKESTTQYLMKIIRVLSYLNLTRDDLLTL